MSNTTTFAWQLDKTFSEPTGMTVRVLQRDVPLEVAALEKELQPFYCPPTLLKVLVHGTVAILRGAVADFAFEIGRLFIGFRKNDESETQARFCLEKVERISLTVWRVNERLDALQLNVECANDWLYLQTGGGLLLDLVFQNHVSSSGTELPCAASELFQVNAHLLARRKP